MGVLHSKTSYDLQLSTTVPSFRELENGSKDQQFALLYLHGKQNPPTQVNRVPGTGFLGSPLG